MVSAISFEFRWHNNINKELDVSIRPKIVLHEKQNRALLTVSRIRLPPSYARKVYLILRKKSERNQIHIWTPRLRTVTDCPRRYAENDGHRVVWPTAVSYPPNGRCIVHGRKNSRFWRYVLRAHFVRRLNGRRSLVLHIGRGRHNGHARYREAGTLNI